MTYYNISKFVSKKIFILSSRLKPSMSNSKLPLIKPTKNMKYLIYIKSHCEAPDYEDEVEAKSKKEAVKYFLTKLNRGDDYWDESMIEKEVVSEEEIFKN